MPNPGRGSSDDPADDPQESPTVIEPVADPTVIPGHPPADESPTVYEPIDRLSLRKSMQNPTEQVAPPTSAEPRRLDLQLWNTPRWARLRLIGPPR